MIGRHICEMCKNLIEIGDNADDWKCNAFPDGIPYEVYAYINHWNPPKDCNNGIGFEPKEKQSDTD